MSLVAHYKLDGDATDSARNNHGAATHMTFPDAIHGTGKWGKFTGTEFGVTVQSDIQATVAAFDIHNLSFFINVPDGVGRDVYAGYYPIPFNFLASGVRSWMGMGAWTSSVNNEVLVLYTNDVTGMSFTTDALLANCTYHISINWNGSNYDWYMNGILISHDDHPTVGQADLLTNITQINIGSDDGTNNYSLRGYLSDVRFYDQSLTLAEIQEIATFPTKDDLLLHYKMTEDSQVMHDSSGNGYDSISVDDTFLDDNGVKNKCTKFTGVAGSVIDTGISQSLLGQTFSFSVWIYPTAESNYRGVMGEHGGTFEGFGFMQTTNANRSASWGDGVNWNGGDVTSQVDIPLNEWTHVVWTLKAGANGSHKVYLNGVLEGEEETTTSFVPWITTNIMIGRSYNTADRYHEGMLEELRIYTKELTQSEIDDLYSYKNVIMSYSKQLVELPVDMEINEQLPAVTDGLIHQFPLTRRLVSNNIHFDPREIRDCAFWVDAARINTSGAITSITDWSGWGNHMVGNATVYYDMPHGRPRIHLTSSQEMLSGFSAVTNVTVFGISRYNGAVHKRVITCDGSGNNWILGHHQAGTECFYLEGWVSDGSGTNDHEEFGIYTARIDTSNSESTVYVNGDMLVANSSGGDAGPNLLGVNVHSTQRSDCDFQEIIAYNRVLTDDEVEIVHNYLKDKWFKDVPGYANKWYGEEDVIWHPTIRSTNIRAIGTKLTKTATTIAWDEGAISGQSFEGFCFVEWNMDYVNKAVNSSTGAEMIGLNSNNSTWSYSDIDYALYTHSNGALRCYENGTNPGGVGATWNPELNNSFRVEYDGTDINYYHNGTNIRNLTASHSGRLCVDSSLHSHGIPNSADNAKVGNIITRELKYTTDGIAVEPSTYNYFINGDFTNETWNYGWYTSADATTHTFIDTHSKYGNALRCSREDGDGGEWSLRFNTATSPITFATGETWVFSFKVRCIRGTINDFGIGWWINDNGAWRHSLVKNYYELDDGWLQVYTDPYTIVDGPYSNPATFMNTQSDYTTFDFTDIQLEKKSYHSAFISNTLNNTVGHASGASSLGFPMTLPDNCTISFDYYLEHGVSDTVISNDCYNSIWWGMFHLADGSLYMHEGASGTSIVPQTYFQAVNTWTHLTIKWTDTIQYFYANGDLLGTLPTNGATTASNIPILYLGTGYNAGYSKFKNFSIFDRALTDDEIKLLVTRKNKSLNNKFIKEIDPIVSPLNYTSWVIGTYGSQPGFSALVGLEGSDDIIASADPWHKTIPIWQASARGSSNADGGWGSTQFAIDNTKLYRFSTWVKRSVVGTGTMYFGTYAYDINGTLKGVYNRTTGTLTTNSYLDARVWPGAAGVWYLLVGHVWPVGSGTGGDRKESGWYDQISGKVYSLVSSYGDFVWKEDSASSVHRTYLYYSTTTAARQQWCYPRVDVIDGTEPSIDDLLSGYDSKRFDDALIFSGNDTNILYSIKDDTLESYAGLGER